MVDSKLDGAPLRTLIVDDFGANLSMMGRMLALLGCDVRECDQPADAAAKARSFQPELVLLDLAMPGMDGFAVAQELRGLNLPPFLLAALTGYSDSETRRRCEDEGFAEFLPKPVSVEQMEAVVARARRQRSQAT